MVLFEMVLARDEEQSEYVFDSWIVVPVALFSIRNQYINSYKLRLNSLCVLFISSSILAGR
jgi:hypothetical protein